MEMPNDGTQPSFTSLEPPPGLIQGSIFTQANNVASIKEEHTLQTGDNIPQVEPQLLPDSNASSLPVSSPSVSPPEIPKMPKILAHPPGHEYTKPPYSYSCLIALSLRDAPRRQLKVGDIYIWIENVFPWYKKAPQAWRNSVRHNLSLNKSFEKVPDENAPPQGIGVVGSSRKGCEWRLFLEFKNNFST